MLKKVISIGMSFLMLFEFGTVNAFAKGGDGDFNTAEGRNTNKENYVDYCKGYPKNSYGKSIDVDCEIEHLFPRFKMNEKRSSLSIPQLGRTGEIDVHMWKYNGLTGLASDFEEVIKSADKESIKRQFAANFLEETNKLFNLNSKEDAAEIINRWAKVSNYSKPFIDSIRDELADWAQKCKSYEDSTSGDVDKTLLGGGIGAFIGGFGGAGFGGLAGVGAGAAGGGAAAAGAGVVAGAGAAVAGAGAVTLAPILFCGLVGDAVIGACGAYYGHSSSKNQKVNQKILKSLKKTEQQKRKWNTYSKALENILQAIDNNEWEGNDLLMAELSYEKALPYARTNFVNEGIGVPKNVTEIFKNLSVSLFNIKKNLEKDRANRKNNKEEL